MLNIPGPPTPAVQLCRMQCWLELGSSKALKFYSNCHGPGFSHCFPGSVKTPNGPVCQAPVSGLRPPDFGAVIFNNLVNSLDAKLGPLIMLERQFSAYIYIFSYICIFFCNKKKFLLNTAQWRGRQHALVGLPSADRDQTYGEGEGSRLRMGTDVGMPLHESSVPWWEDYLLYRGLWACDIRRPSAEWAAFVPAGTVNS